MPQIQALLDSAFPFHVRIDPQTVVQSFGRSLARLCPGLVVGERLDAFLVCDHTGKAITPGDLDDPTRVVILQVGATGTVVRCQALPAPPCAIGPASGDDATAPGDRVLLMTPWLPSPNHLQKAGLQLTDFAPHDPTPDYAFLAQAQLTALNDARRLADRLADLEAVRRHESLHDPLTGAANRRWFTQQLTRCPPDSSLVLVDVDLFKEINDAYGHLMGDQVLVNVAQRLSILAPEAEVIRLGGDEFAVLLTGDAAGFRSQEIAAGIVEAMRVPTEFEGQRVTTSVSVGVAPPADSKSLARNADVALYAAKQQGRGRLVVFDSTVHESLVHRLELRDRLRHAIADGAISVVYQPIVSLATGRIHSFEALARWTDPQFGAVRPDVFVQIAEEIGLIDDLGRFVLEVAVEQLALWRRRYPGLDLRMSVNLSPSQLEVSGLPTRVGEILDRHHVPAGCLQLELTESAFTSHRKHADQLAEIRRMGIPVAIDDFGSAESTLARLHAVPVSILKIDRAFLAQLDEAPDRTTRLLRAVVSIAETFEMTTVLEGIETTTHLDVARAVGCTRGQGYLFAKPLPVSQADAYLAEELAPVPAQGWKG